MVMSSHVTSAFSVFSCLDSALLFGVRGEQRAGPGSKATESISIVVKKSPCCAAGETHLANEKRRFLFSL